jgi:hypothetical protein
MQGHRLRGSAATGAGVRLALLDSRDSRRAACWPAPVRQSGLRTFGPGSASVSAAMATSHRLRAGE